jgi:hypothetical protein
VIQKEVGRYEVIGRRAYREHEPGSVFEARLDLGAEQRAVARGSIRVLGKVPADLPARWRLPIGWPTSQPQEGS